MNRFETYQPINIELPEYVQNPEAFAKILAGQDALFEQKQKEKESMLSAGDKLAQSLKYAPEESYKAIYDQTLADYRAAQDEVENAYKTKGISAGEAALRKYKKTLSDDFTNGRAAKLMSSATQWEDTKKRVTEMYKDNPQAAYYYLNGAGKSEWFKPYEEGKDANIGQPSLLKSLKDSDVTKAIVETLSKTKPDVETLVSYMTPDAPQWVINGVKTSSDPYHYIMDKAVRKYINGDKLMSGVLGNLSPDVLEHMELEGRIKGMKGMGDMKNLIATYATDKDGNVIELKTPEEIDAAKQNEDLVVRTTFNPKHPYGSQFNNLMRNAQQNELTHDFDIIQNGLAHQEDLRMREKTLAQQAKNAADDNYWKKLNYLEKRRENDIKEAENAVSKFSVPGQNWSAMPSFARIDDKTGQPVVDNKSISEFKTSSQSRIKEINNMIGNTAKPLAPEQVKALREEKVHLESELKNIEHMDRMFEENPEQFGYVPDKKAEEELKRAGYYDTMNLKINDNMTQIKVSDLLKRDDLVVKKDGIYKRGTKQNVRGDIMESDTKIGIIGDKQYQTYLSAKRASELNKSNIENRNNAKEKYYESTITGGASMASTNPMPTEALNKQFNTTANNFLASLPAKTKVIYDNKEYTLPELAAKTAVDAGHTDWTFTGFDKGDKTIPATVQYGRKGTQTQYGVSSVLTANYIAEDGKTYKRTINITVPSHTKEGIRNFSEPTLDSELYSPTKRAEIDVQQAAGRPKILIDENDYKIYSAPGGRFYEVNNGSKSEIPKETVTRLLSAHYVKMREEQLNGK